MKKKLLLGMMGIAWIFMCGFEQLPTVTPAAPAELQPVAVVPTVTPAVVPSVTPAAPTELQPVAVVPSVTPVAPTELQPVAVVPTVTPAAPTELPPVAVVPTVTPVAPAPTPTAAQVLTTLYGPRYSVGAVNVNNNANLYILGDSRTVMGALDTGYDVRANWYAASGTTLSYMIEKFVPIIDSDNLNGKTIVIMYGVNDVMFMGPDYAKLNYRMFLLGKAQEWIQKGAKVYMASVPGVSSQLDFAAPGMSSSLINMNVCAFNDFVRANLPTGVGYLPVNLIHPLAYDDGLHYTAEESMLLYENIINQLAH